MFQKEVADRILAKPNTKEYGRIAILTNFRLDIVKSFKISRNCFFPKPSVDSKIIVFKPKLKIDYKIADIKNLEKITNIFFSNKRKMINKPFSKIFKEYKSIAENLKINLHSRPSELSNNDYYKLTEYYEKINLKY
jgi:16S rRNA (adenine1518-N6/adenine1519-N6)-dimethyltransferase